MAFEADWCNETSTPYGIFNVTPPPWDNTGVYFGHRFSCEDHLVMQILQLGSLGDVLEVLLPLFCYIYILLTTRSTFSVLNFKLRMQTNYPLDWMFLFHILASAFPTSYHIKTVCSCWVWKLSYDTCLLNVVLSASFLLQSDWLEKKAN